MIVGHRWEYRFDLLEYRCVPLPFGGVESHQWCVGCGCSIGEIELRDARIPMEEFSEIYLDILTSRKGYEPVEAGTIAEWKLRRKEVLNAP